MDELQADELPHHNVNASRLHDNHARLHSQLMAAILIFLVFSQLLLVFWRSRSPRTFRRATLVGAWLAVPCIALSTHWWLAGALWLAYTLAGGRLVRRALRVPLDRSTPRDVYAFFLFVFRLSQAVASAGYLVLCVEFLVPALLPMFGSVAWMALQLIAFGLYFGMLGRDTAELCADRMALTLGYGAKLKDDGDDDSAALPRRMATSNACAICALPLINIDRGGETSSGGSSSSSSAADEDNVVTLSCKHRYHEMCLRGWTIVGKKAVCAACGEKAQYDDVAIHPWQRTSVLWAQCLDAMGLLIVWNPLIILSMQAMIVWADR
jgi:RING finger protein 121